MKQWTRWMLGATAVALVGTTYLLSTTKTLMPPTARWDSPEPDAHQDERSSIAVLATSTGTEPAVTFAQVSRQDRSPAAEEVKLCGGEWVRVDPNGAIDEAALWQLEPVKKAGLDILANLANGQTEIERATAMWIQGIIEDARRSPSEEATKPDSLTAASEPQASPATEKGIRDHPEALQTLARHAVSTTDPRVYALAMSGCAGQANIGSCGMLSTEQWARLDPGNARPWLHLLGEAAERKDVAARNEALHRMATSNRMEDSLSVVPALIIDAGKADDSLVAAMTLVMFALGTSAALPIPYQSVWGTCRDSKGDANLAQVCSNVATVLAGSSSLLDRGVGIRLGRRLGWPAETADRMNVEVQQMLLAPPAGFPRQGDVRASSCGNLRKALDAIRRRATEGEVAAGQEAVASSVTPFDEMTKQVRDRREKQEEEEIARQQGGLSTPPAPVVSAASSN